MEIKLWAMVPKKLVSTAKSAYISVSNESILQIYLILSSPNLVLTFYTYKISNKKVSSYYDSYDSYAVVYPRIGKKMPIDYFNVSRFFGRATIKF
jgi:hypothetical protein